MLTLINKYFPALTPEQYDQLNMFADLLLDWNEKINLISRKDTANIEQHHILHSLAIAKFIGFKSDTDILDLGSGGGLPGIPLAILFPDSSFHLIDRIGKKMSAAKDITEKLGLKNVTTTHGDVSELKKKFHFIVNRGVMPQPDIIKAVRKIVSEKNFNALPNGVISLKGGDLTNELKSIQKQSEIVGLNNYFQEPFFETKKIVYTPVYTK